MKKITLEISGMKCQGCVNTVKNLLKNVDGVIEVNVDLNQNKAEVHANESINQEKLTDTIEKNSNYHARIVKIEDLI